MAETYTPAGSEPLLPDSAPRVRLSALGERPAASCETVAPVLIIGGREDCDLPIHHTDVSKVHCAVVNTGRAIVVVDLCSRTGTFIDDQRVRAAILKPGDSLRVGSVGVDLDFTEAPTLETDPDALRLHAPLKLATAQNAFELETLPAVVGRRQTCDVVLDTPDVSLAHCLLFQIEGRPAIFDLGSRSGTIVNAKRVTHAWLNDGDELVVGGEQVKVGWSAPPLAADPAAAAGVAESHSAAPPAAPEPAPDPAPPETHSVAAPPAFPAAPVACTASSGSEEVDIEALVAGLESQLGPLRQLLQARSQALSERERAVHDQQAWLDFLRDELNAESDRLHQRSQKLEELEREISTRAEANRENLKALERQRAELERKQADLNAALAQLDAERTGLQESEAQLAQRGQALQAGEQRLAQERGELADQAAALQARARTLSEREAALAQREAFLQERTRQLEQFRRALHQAQQAFAEMGRPAAVGSPDLAGAPAPTLRPARARGGAHLPAPMVAVPIFVPPQDPRVRGN